MNKLFSSLDLYFQSKKPSRPFFWSLNYQPIDVDCCQIVLASTDYWNFSCWIFTACQPDMIIAQAERRWSEGLIGFWLAIDGWILLSGARQADKKMPDNSMALYIFFSQWIHSSIPSICLEPYCWCLTTSIIQQWRISDLGTFSLFEIQPYFFYSARRHGQHRSNDLFFIHLGCVCPSFLNQI